MAEEPDNLVLQMLREMRKDISQLKEDGRATRDSLNLVKAMVGELVKASASDEAGPEHPGRQRRSGVAAGARR